MPRSTRKAAEALITSASGTTAAPLKLSPEAQRLFDDVSSKWVLHRPAEELLRLACEALTRSHHYASLVDQHGATVASGAGCRPHPCVKMETDNRAQASATLQKLLLHLEGS